MKAGLRRSDWLIAAGFALVTYVTRWPMRTSTLAYWDSVLYARALDEFTIVAHQPQPPGYLFYVLSARLAHWLIGGDANAAYVMVSMVASAGLVASIYLVAVAIYGRSTGMASALLALTAVAPWAYAGVAYPYTVLGLGSAVLGGLAWGLRQRRVPPWLAGLALGLLSGFRQDLLIFLGPLMVVSLGRRSPRDYLLAMTALAVGGLAWFLPSAWLSGGIPAYIGALGRQSLLVERDTSIMADGLAGLLWNVDHLRLFLVEQTLLLATVPLVIYIVARLRHGHLWSDIRDRHLVMWTAPGLLFYSLIHLGDVGYVFSIVPPLLIGAGVGVALVARWVASRSNIDRWTLHLPRGLAVTPALVVWALLAAGPALYHDYYIFHTGRQYSMLWTTCRDDALRNTVQAVRQRLRPEDTLIVAAGYYEHARHYLPEYRAWLAAPDTDGAFRRPVPPEVRHVVAFGYRMTMPDQRPNEERIIVSCDNTLSIFQVEPGQVITYVPDFVAIE